MNQPTPGSPLTGFARRFVLGITSVGVGVRTVCTRNIRVTGSDALLVARSDVISGSLPRHDSCGDWPLQFGPLTTPR